MEQADKDYGEQPFTAEEILLAEGQVTELAYRASISFQMPVQTVLQEPGNQYSGRTVTKPTASSMTITREMKMQVPEELDINKCRGFLRHEVVTDLTWEYEHYIKHGRLNHYKDKI